ncbi:hypothetical protein C1H46_002036 [Malus baccata]|uniref:Uncharacterized protein n=1 Tax=Malus baccata TaxID=106549 RepID=A0A540NP52_MALBA|nr:hypothetical protein C1H46_002036 [Malus baccata]
MRRCCGGPRWNGSRPTPKYGAAFSKTSSETMEIDVGELEAKDQKLLLDGLLAISFQPTEVGRNRKVRGSSFVGGGRHLLNNKPINLCLVD